MKQLITSLIILCFCIPSFAENEKHPDKNPTDTLKVYYLDEVIVSSSVKETNDLKNLPTGVSVLSPKQLRNIQIESLPALSAVVPNFFIPSYGSKVSTPIYIRGIGTRLGSQTVSLYVDNVPSFNPSGFDFEFQDIQRVEVLRGAQGTLYGRNAIGGIVNIYTLLPLSYQGTSLSLSGGNHGQMAVKASNYSKLTDNFGLSLAAYYKKDDGYFINNYTGKLVDDSKNVGAKLKMEWQLSPTFKAMLFGNYDYISQGAFPYMHQDSSAVNFNEPSSYNRHLVTNGLSLQHMGNEYSVNSTTGYQFLKDDMRMDQDYTPMSIFAIRQEQTQHSISQEITVKSENERRYRWVVGAFGFYDHRLINTPVTIKKDGTPFLLHRLTALAEQIPNFPTITLVNEEIQMPGEYKKPVWGAALFHQSSLNDLFGVHGLSTTFGLRLDYEHTQIDYFTETQGVEMNVKLKTPPGAPPVSFNVPADTTIQGGLKKDYWEILPKLALKYQPTQTAFVYLSASKGYKTGGYNEQAFSQILRNAMQKAIMNKIPPGMMPNTGTPPTNQPKPLTLEEQLSYAPERSWTFELGGRCEMFDKKLSATFALFHTLVDNIQIIQLLDQGTAGRIVTNAGKSTSDGVELGLRYTPVNNFSLFAEYGFANALFKNYLTEKIVNGRPTPVDYSGNSIPFAPKHTLSVGTSYVHSFAYGSFIERLSGNIQYMGAGKIYWTEANNAYQPFYGITNASIAAEKGAFGLEIWAKNLFNTQYNAFYIEVSDMAGVVSPIVQHGYPTRLGATLRYTLNR